jgi:thioredoxin reductase (NADPH)
LTPPFLRKFMYDIVVIGGGPAGLTAAIYARRNGKTVLVVEKEGFGGQMAASPRVSNYPGFPSVSGAELTDAMLAQALDLGAETELALVTAVRREGNFFCVVTDGGEFMAEAVVLAAGVKHRRLGLPGEEELVGNGLSFCAVCDGAFYENKTVAVIGGGNSALQEALLLADTCREVVVCHRRDFTAERHLQDELFARPNVTAVTGVVVRAFLRGASGALRGLKLAWVRTGEETEIPCDGVFEAVGLVPENEAFAGLACLDEAGYIDAGEDCLTSCPGVFAAGDCRRKSVRQIATAVGDGAAAALAACRWADLHSKSER